MAIATRWYRLARDDLERGRAARSDAVPSCPAVLGEEGEGHERHDEERRHHGLARHDLLGAVRVGEAVLDKRGPERRFQEGGCDDGKDEQDQDGKGVAARDAKLVRDDHAEPPERVHAADSTSVA